ncbi:Uncharacterized membrane protein YhaH, DUF805 family [Cyclonatronum proteinivorum]|uniref:Uncharacterized membrane protein YhaH, DUF805 family n=1 Tax=Cyclonatronum proteinivorum TaxID=1457365 RepID=A0A345UJ26_9BACT|nr:DUF805 domain-containing protein [Cyclonatronum proteinivorum]AXJ00478.1 Uncharacterized membrane protein YhaH, DUF805 family [Cyclonatronum proteinivorum]
MKWYFKALNRYTDFSGRSRRREFWLFWLFNVLIFFVITSLGTWFGVETDEVFFYGTLYNFAVLVPSLAVTVRRMHDSNRSGWWILVIILPAFGLFALLYFLLVDGTPGDNYYGPDPKAETNIGSAALPRDEDFWKRDTH